MWDVINNPCTNFNARLAKQPLKSMTGQLSRLIVYVNAIIHSSLKMYGDLDKEYKYVSKRRPSHSNLSFYGWDSGRFCMKFQLKKYRKTVLIICHSFLLNIYIYYINQLLQPPCDMRPSQITTFSLICSWNNCFRRLNREYWTLSIAQVVMLKPMRHNCFYASKQSGSKLRLSEDRWNLSGICRNRLTTSDHVCGGKIDMGVK